MFPTVLDHFLIHGEKDNMPREFLNVFISFFFFVFLPKKEKLYVH